MAKRGRKQKGVSQELHAKVKTTDEAGNVTEETITAPKDEMDKTVEKIDKEFDKIDAELGEGEEKPTELPLDSEAKSTPAHIEIYTQRTAELEKQLVEADLDWAHKDADAKAAKKMHETLREASIDHLGKTPQPGLFDKEGVCRKCQIHEGEFDKFATDDLCQRCADKLGKEVEQGKNPDAMSKQAQEVLETCPECNGKGMVGETKCVNCEGTGQLPALPDVPEDEIVIHVVGGLPPEDIEPVEVEEAGVK